MEAMWKPWPIEIDDFPSELNLHVWLGFSMAMLNNQMVILVATMVDNAGKKP
jgi:hypothetical protein